MGVIISLILAIQPEQDFELANQNQQENKQNKILASEFIGDLKQCHFKNDK